MSKVQCTFRLPKKVVELIDQQEGNTRTDKLLSLLGFSEDDTDYSVMQNVVSNEIIERLSIVEDRLNKLETPPSTKPRPKKKSANQVEAPKLEPINGQVSHAEYRNEIDQFVMALVDSGHSLQMITDILNELGWVTQRGEKWTRNSVGAITRRMKESYSDNLDDMFLPKGMTN